MRQLDNEFKQITVNAFQVALISILSTSKEAEGLHDSTLFFSFSFQYLCV